MTVLAMFILSAGIQRSGLIHVLGKRLFPLVGRSELRLLLVIALLVGPISGFINNTAAVAVAIPLVLEMARRSGVSATRLLLPLSFVGMLGGTLTLVGTSTNILASTLLSREPAFGREIGMFEFTHLGAIVLAVGLRQIMDLIETSDVEVLSEFGEVRRVRGDGLLVRALLRNRQAFGKHTGASVDLWGRYRARLIGLETDSVRGRRLADEPLHVGEIVLVEVSKSVLLRLRRHPDLVVLTELEDDFDRRRMAVAAGIVAAVVAGAALTPLPIVVTALIGVVAMAVTGCISRDDIYAGVAWEVVILLAGVIPLGIAMSKSGAADWLGGLLATHAAGWHPIVVLMVLYLVTTLLTELVSNNAAVVVLVPVVISLAESLQIAVLPLALAVMFAASTSFLTPVGYQTNSMVYGTGLYRFTDFARIGAPLNALLLITTSLAIYWLWLR